LKKIQSLLAEPLLAVGFRSTRPFLFEKQLSPDIRGWISLGVSGRGSIDLLPSVSFRDERVERILSPSAGCDATAPRATGTVMLESLCAGGPSTWRLDHEVDPGPMTTWLAKNIIEFGTPFLTMHDSIEKIAGCMLRSQFKYLGEHQGVVFAAVLYIARRVAEAVAVLVLRIAEIEAHPGHLQVPHMAERLQQCRSLLDFIRRERPGIVLSGSG
jgi:hypothetical protein